MKLFNVEWRSEEFVFPERSQKNTGKPAMVYCSGQSKIMAESEGDAFKAMTSMLGKKSNVTGYGSYVFVSEV